MSPIICLSGHLHGVGDLKAADDQFADFEPSDFCAPDNQAADRDRAKGNCTECDRAGGKGPDGLRRYRHSASPNDSSLLRELP